MALPTSYWRKGSGKLRETRTFGNPKIKAELRYHCKVTSGKDIPHHTIPS